MKIETILNAYDDARYKYYQYYQYYHQHGHAKRERQYEAFRDRILKMYRERDRQASKSFNLWTTERGITNDLRRQIAKNDAEIAELRLNVDELLNSIDEMLETIAKKDAEIARLWKEIDLLKAENVRKMDETNRLKIEREFSDD